MQHVLILRKKIYSLFSNPSQFDLFYVGQHAWEEKCWAGYVFKMLLSTHSHTTQSLLKHRLLYPLLAVPGIAIQTGQLSLKPSCPSWLQGWQIKNHSHPTATGAMSLAILKQELMRTINRRGYSE